MRRLLSSVTRTSPVLAALALLSGVASAQQSSGRPPASGTSASPAATPSAVYTAAQAARGDKTFTARCASCHGRKDFNNPDFHLKWNGRTVHDLFEQVRNMMPENDPGSLPLGEYEDVVAYLLKLNGMPEGKKPLAPGPALRQARLVLSGPR